MSEQTIIQGDCLQEMRQMADCSITHILTDPPYGISFMGKEWDHGIPGVEFWREALRIAMPGSMLLAFGGTRTYHRLACAIEDAGWQIRDCMMYLYGSGFPKSHNKFGFDGYGTALKPAWEPIIVAMKPLDGTFKQNAEKWGVAGINIDGCRIGTSECLGRENPKPSTFVAKINETYVDNTKGLGRWPANLILDSESATLLDEQTGILKSGDLKPWVSTYKTDDCGFGSTRDYEKKGDSGGASRFFYCAKASSAERNAGLDKPNSHPTIKPIRLMEYLLKLITPPNGGIVLDPFCGSGSTLVAARNLGINAVGIELQEEYCEIARRRIDAG